MINSYLESHPWLAPMIGAILYLVDVYLGIQRPMDAGTLGQLVWRIIRQLDPNAPKRPPEAPMFFKIPKLFFVAKASTIELSPQPTLPFDVAEGRALALTQVSSSYTQANFGSAWTLAVALNGADAQRVGLVNLTLDVKPATA